MLHYLLLLCRRFAAWLMPAAPGESHHEAYPAPFRPSNLHARHFR